jgi:hypothetical protein
MVRLMELLMRSKEMICQRPLFADWPVWHTLPVDVRQKVEQELVNICLEVVTHPNDTENALERYDEQPTD